MRHATLLTLLLLAGSLQGQLTPGKILNASREPQNWLTYSGGYSSQRYSPLDKINPDNVKSLQLKWIYRPDSRDKMEATPLVVNGILYMVQGDEVVALDAVTDRKFWTFTYEVPPESNAYLMVVKGDPNPGWGGDTRPGDDLYSDPVLAQDADNISTWANYSQYSCKGDPGPWIKDKTYTALGARSPADRVSTRVRGVPAAYRREEDGYGAFRALDPQTGERKWEFKMSDYTESGVLTTASDRLFAGGRDGNFFALDARDGRCRGRWD